MKTKTILFALCLLILIACLLGLTVNENNTNSIRLRFNSNYKGDSIEIQKIGLIWALSYLGADLPKQSFENALKKLDKSNYELHVDRIGFEPFAIKAMQVIIKSLKQSEEYKKMGGIDLDEFVVYTLGSSNHYYQITGAKQTYTQFKSNFDFSKEQVFPVLNSDVAKHHRLIRMSDSKKVSKMAFIAEEGVGDLVTKTFQAEVYEVFDIMKNGQLRFAIYDKTGNLMEASPASLGNAGKPVKCLWCHEINIQSLFTKNDSVKDYISPRQFQELIRNKMQSLQAYRTTLKGEVDYTKTQDHAFMELLYINFMEPSMYKLSNEWQQPLDLLTKKLKKIKKHSHREYSFLKDLMDRSSIKKYSPYTTVQLPDSIWEGNKSEPNMFK